ATKLAISNKKTTYNTGKYPIITLKDKNNKILKHMKITVTLNGKKTTRTTDNKGQVKLTGLVPKTYRITIKFNGNEKYFNSTLSTKISVLKANSKIVAKNAVFKRTAKHKRYSILLKDNKNKAIKNTKISLRIYKKTFTTKTNSKGLATFKLDKFTKKGIYTSLIKFTGNNYFKASSKKTYIAVI
ncbi:carboxypeptidase-like regulatory domain-containing protein, partial [Methanobrevibacter sp.]